MSNEINTENNHNTTSENNKKMQHSTPYFLWFVVLLLVIALAYVSYIGYKKEQEFNSVVNDLKQVNLELKKTTDAGDVSSKKIGLLANEQTSAENKIKQLELQLNKLAEQTDDLYKIKQELISGRNDLFLLELRQAIFLTKQTLQNTFDLPQAILILENAKNQVDSFLANNIDNIETEKIEAIKQLQISLNNDLILLKKLPVLDIDKINQQFNLIKEYSFKWNLFSTSRPVENLNTINNKNPEKNTANLVEKSQNNTNNSQNFWDKTMDYIYNIVENSWSDIRELIRIQKIEGDNKDDFLLSPQQEWFLRENIRLHLLNAKLAFLMYEGEVFNSELNLLQQKINKYFDNNNEQVKNSLKLLEELKKTPFIKIPVLESENFLNNK